MARQEGIILLTGPVGDLSFYKSKGNYFVRRKSGVSAERINSEPAYARTRENIAEFRCATLAAKLFRNTFQSLFHDAADNRVSSRLTGLMVKVIQGDPKSPRGQRRVNDGNLSLLERFQINRHSSLTSTLQVPFTASIDRVAGTIVIDLPSFVPDQMISAPRGATHYCLKGGAAAIDFEGNTSSASTSTSADLSISETLQPPQHLCLTLPPASTHPLFLVLAIEFLQQVNGIRYPMSARQHNAIAIVKVDGPVRNDPSRSKFNRRSRSRAQQIKETLKLRPPVCKVLPLPAEDLLLEDNALYAKFRHGRERVEKMDSS